MNLKKFIEDIEKELELRILNKNNTPILDRLEMHLEQLDEPYNLATMLNPQNVKSELYLSMLYQIAHPAKKIQKFSIEVDNKILPEEKNRKQAGISLLKVLGTEVLINHPQYQKYVFNSPNEFYKKYANNVTLLEINGLHLSVLHILYSNGKNTLEKFQNFINSINEHLQYKKIKIYDNSYYQL
jgi:hypothetical protein